jgi:hypothetical protein
MIFRGQTLRPIRWGNKLQGNKLLAELNLAWSSILNLNSR